MNILEVKVRKYIINPIKEIFVLFMVSRKILNESQFSSDSVFLSGNHLCKKCGISFHTKNTYQQHIQYLHCSTTNSTKKILILGGGFGGVNVLRRLQKIFENNVNVSITLVNEDNFFLYTPMLPEVASGMIHPSNITVPIRTFCKRAKFYQASVSSIDLKQKLVTINRSFDGKVDAIEYDHLVIALGSLNNFFGNNNLKKHSFTIKTVEDAIGIRNHVINMLEHAAQTTDMNHQKKLMTFVVVGGGFAGVETIGEINHFVRESAKNFYPDIDQKNINMILISAKSGILPELDEKMSKSAMDYLSRVGVRIIINSKAIDAEEDYVLLNNDKKIKCSTLIWAGGVTVSPVIHNLDCKHDLSGKIIVDKYLRICEYPNVYAMGDCAASINEKTGELYPPTAQHAIHQSNVVSKNLKSMINDKKDSEVFSYSSKGMMAIIGKRTATVSILGHNLQGFLAWIIWRSYYLLQIPTFEKRIKVLLDWTIHLIFKPDITCVGEIKKKSFNKISFEELPPLKEMLFPDLEKTLFSK